MNHAGPQLDLFVSGGKLLGRRETLSRRGIVTSLSLIDGQSRQSSRITRADGNLCLALLDRLSIGIERVSFLPEPCVCVAKITMRYRPQRTNRECRFVHLRRLLEVALVVINRAH